MDLRHRRAAIGLAAAAVGLVAIATQIYAESLENEEYDSDEDLESVEGDDSGNELHSASSPVHSYWLMKAEPDSRVVKGKDVKFSVDDFESVVTTAWEGVRNAEARNLMKEMSAGDKVLFYHSNCKNPGIAAFAEVSQEAYPDYTAWDASHPYFDAKTDKDEPKWFMVDVKFSHRTAHFVSLALLKRIASDGASELTYLNEEDIKAIEGMALINRGRLSVQRVEQEAWNVIEKLAANGGWEDSANSNKTTTKRTSSKKRQRQSEDKESGGDNDATDTPQSKGRKRKAAQDCNAGSTSPKRRSTRIKTEQDS